MCGLIVVLLVELRLVWFFFLFSPFGLWCQVEGFELQSHLTAISISLRSSLNIIGGIRKAHSSTQFGNHKGD